VLSGFRCSFVLRCWYLHYTPIPFMCARTSFHWCTILLCVCHHVRKWHTSDHRYATAQAIGFAGFGHTWHTYSINKVFVQLAIALSTPLYLSFSFACFMVPGMPKGRQQANWRFRGMPKRYASVFINAALLYWHTSIRYATAIELHHRTGVSS
jgi:hypothetical protein